jgi:F420H(2)-dependent quinone reductase
VSTTGEFSNLAEDVDNSRASKPERSGSEGGRSYARACSHGEVTAPSDVEAKPPVGGRHRAPSSARSQVTQRQEALMNDRRYIKPPWMQRHVGNRMSVLFRPSLISKLSVRGRRSGRWHTTPVAVLEHNGERYLVSYRGASDWARNLEASHAARLTQPSRAEDIEVVDVPAAERDALLCLPRPVRQDAHGRPGTAGPPRPSGPPHLPDHPIACRERVRALRWVGSKWRERKLDFGDRTTPPSRTERRSVRARNRRYVLRARPHRALYWL